MVLGSVLTGSSALSSSTKPFLNDLMPLAKSPISSEILPRPPNSRSTTAPAMIQCQMLSEPMSLILRADGPHGPWGHTGPLGGTESRPAMRQKQGLQKMPSFRGAPKGASPEPIATAAVCGLSVLHALGRRRQAEIEVARIERVLVVMQRRIVGGHRHREAGRQAAVKETGTFEFFEAGQIDQCVEPEMRQEGFRGAVGQRPTGRLSPPARADPAGLQQHVDRALGGGHATDI